MKTRLIDANQLKGILTLTVPTSEEYAKALKKTMEIISKHPQVIYSEPLECPSDMPVITSGTIHADFSNIPSQTIIALQCKSCGGIIDKDTMTCKHCGMTYMLVNSSEINPRLIYPDF